MKYLGKLTGYIDNFQWNRNYSLILLIVVVWLFYLTLILNALNKGNIDNKSLFHSWSFSKINYVLFGIGLFVIILGYIVMATGETESVQSVKIAPLILIFGYCVCIPIAILIKPKDKA